MATVTKNQFRAHQYGATPYGNMSSLAYSLKTDATGKPLESDATAALAVGDVVDLGPLQEGWRLEDASIFITTAMTASVTGSLGFKYADGVDDTKVPQDATYFISGGSLATAGRLRANTGKLVTLPKPARLILTIAGAANANVSDLKVVVQGEMKGPR